VKQRKEQRRPVLLPFLRLLALAMGFAGWAVVAIIFYWVESSGGEVLLSNNRVWPRYEAVADMVAIAIAFFIIAAALTYELLVHYRGK
jgi:uncharacterized membrane protein